MILHVMWRYSPVQCLVHILKICTLQILYSNLYNHIFDDILSIPAVLWYLKKNFPLLLLHWLPMSHFWCNVCFLSLFSFNNMFTLLIFFYQIAWISQKVLFSLFFFSMAICRIAILFFQCNFAMRLGLFKLHVGCRMLLIPHVDPRILLFI